jgi:MFS family permease
MFASCSITLLWGKVYANYSVRWAFVIALGFFELGSLVCGVTPTSKGLIVGRAVAGLGAGGILPGAMIMLAHSVPLRKRPLYIGLVGGMSGIATVAGPL